MNGMKFNVEDADLVSQFVDQHYQPNWETEEFLFDGTELRDGMVVLLADPGMRMKVDPMYLNDPNFLDAVMMRNRWCWISRVHVEDQQVFFLAAYADGTLQKRRHQISVSWLAKKEISVTDSTPTEVPISGERMLTDEAIRHRFAHHKPVTEEARQRHVRLRLLFMNVAKDLDSILPLNREKSEMMELLEITAMWAHKSATMGSEE